MNIVSLWIGCVLEIMIGDPEEWPHPVRGIGWMITRGEAPARRWIPDPRTAGVGLVAVILAATTLPVYLMKGMANKLPCRTGDLTRSGAITGDDACAAGAASAAVVLFDGIVLYLVLAAHQLIAEGLQLQRTLETGDLHAARHRLSRLVSRRTEEMNETAIIKGTIETMSENFADGFFTPLFYFVMGGPVAAVAYKTINTMDSMIGYRNERYREFGWATARLDDLVNWLPARLAGLILVVASPLAGCSPARAWRIMIRDGRKHESPNAGIGKAAIAGALGVQIGGPAQYGDVIVERPFIGDHLHPLTPSLIRETARLLLAGCAVSVALAWVWLRRGRR